MKETGSEKLALREIPAPFVGVIFLAAIGFFVYQYRLTVPALLVYFVGAIVLGFVVAIVVVKLPLWLRHVAWFGRAGVVGWFALAGIASFLAQTFHSLQSPLQSFAPELRAIDDLLNVPEKFRLIEFFADILNKRMEFRINKIHFAAVCG